MKTVKFFYFLSFLTLLIVNALIDIVEKLSVNSAGGVIVCTLLMLVMVITAAFILLPHTPDN